MKLKYFLPFIAILFLRCTPDRGPVKFQMEYFDETFTIGPGHDPLLTHGFIFDNISTDIEAYKAEFDIEEDDIISITPRRFRITNISTPDEYDFLNEISVKILDPDDPDRKFEIFYHLANNQNLGASLDLIPNDTDLKSFMVNRRFSIEVQLVRFRQRPPTSITTRFEMSFDVR